MTVAAVVHSWCSGLDTPGRGCDLALWGVAVTDDQPAASLVTLVGVRMKVGAAFGLETIRIAVRMRGWPAVAAVEA